MTGITIENAQPLVGGIVHVDKAHLCDDDVIAQIKTALETRGVLVFPRLNASDDEQLAFTDKMGERVNFTRQVPGADVTAADVYMITLDRKLNNEPDYVLGTFFWHVAGATIDHALPKATTSSARQLSASGGSILTRLIQWAAQPDFVYRHDWQVGDMVIWDNEGLMHRVVPYTDEGRVIHRTTIAGHNKPGHVASEADHAKLFELA